MGRLALVALLAGCGAPMPYNELADPPPGADCATDIAISSWEYAFGKELGDPPPILWFEGECLDYGARCLYGATMVGYSEPPEIHLLADEPIGDGHLAHEVLHWALYRLGREDEDHSAPEWNNVNYVRDRLRAAGF